VSSSQFPHEAIVVPCSSPNAYAVVRSLTPVGIRILALDHVPETPLRYSRRCRFRLCPDPGQSESRFVAALLEIAARMNEKPVVFPTQDLHTVVLCRHRVELEESVVFPFMDMDAALDCVDKRRMYPLAEGVGLLIPETHFPHEPNELLRMMPLLYRFPYVVKPAAKFEICEGMPCRNFEFYLKYGTKALRCRDTRELLSTFSDVWENGFSTVVQEEIEGPASTLWAIDFYASRDSLITGFHTGHKIRQLPSDFGTCTLGRSVEREGLLQTCSSLVKAIHFHGIGNVEFKERDGNLYFLEINPRPWQWLSLATVSGVNLPLLAYRDLLNLSAGEVPRQRRSVLWVDLRRDARHLRLFNGRSTSTERLGFLGWLRSVRLAKSEAISSMSDPFPLLAVAARKLARKIWRK